MPRSRNFKGRKYVFLKLFAKIKFSRKFPTFTVGRDGMAKSVNPDQIIPSGVV